MDLFNKPEQTQIPIEFTNHLSVKKYKRDEEEKTIREWVHDTIPEDVIKLAIQHKARIECFTDEYKDDAFIVHCKYEDIKELLMFHLYPAP